MPNPSMSPADAGARNLKRLFVLRWIALTATAAVIAMAKGIAGIELPLVALGLVIGAAVVLNAWTGMRLRSARPVHDPELFLQLLADVFSIYAGANGTEGVGDQLYLLIGVRFASPLLAQGYYANQPVLVPEREEELYPG